MTTQLQRDPFARTTTVRMKAQPTAECAFCGQPARFVYGTHRDDRHRPDWQRRAFCGRSCERAYNH